MMALLVVILAAYFLPHLIRTEHRTPTAKEIAELKAVGEQLNKEHTNHTVHEDVHSPPASLFYFDPNTISAEGWEQLGLRAKTIGTILKYLSKGGHFYKPDDLKKIYGLHAKDYERLEPYIRIDKRLKHPDKNYKNETAYVRNAPAPKPAYKKPQPKLIDINDADTSAFIALPGIGGKLAARIIAFRERLGGFHTIEQIAETYGLPDSTFQSIRPFMVLSNPRPRQLNINTATLETLRQHPYIKWGLATAIIRYREQHGPFKSLQDLQQLAPVTPAIYHKILPYLAVSD